MRGPEGGRKGGAGRSGTAEVADDWEGGVVCSRSALTNRNHRRPPYRADVLTKVTVFSVRPLSPSPSTTPPFHALQVLACFDASIADLDPDSANAKTRQNLLALQQAMRTE